MIILETVMDKLTVKPDDKPNTVVLKAIGMGALEGAAIVGALHVISNVTGIKLTK